MYLWGGGVYAVKLVLFRGTLRYWVVQSLEGEEQKRRRDHYCMYDLHCLLFHVVVFGREHDPWALALVNPVGKSSWQISRPFSAQMFFQDCFFAFDLAYSATTQVTSYHVTPDQRRPALELLTHFLIESEEKPRIAVPKEVLGIFPVCFFFYCDECFLGIFWCLKLTRCPSSTSKMQYVTVLEFSVFFLFLTVESFKIPVSLWLE